MKQLVQMPVRSLSAPNAIGTDLDQMRMLFIGGPSTASAAIPTSRPPRPHRPISRCWSPRSASASPAALSRSASPMSRAYPTDRQGTALGIFGVGNVGAAVTKFLAPFVLVACGWQAVAQVWAVGLAVMAVVFWFTTSDDPVMRAAPRARRKTEELLAELAPLKNVQVWRFALYYFFVFGAFVALALWLPRYLIGVYGLDITTAGMIGAAYSIPGQHLPRLRRRLSDRFGARARDVLDVRRLGRRHVHPVLSADRLCRARHQAARSPSTSRSACLPSS